MSPSALPQVELLRPSANMGPAVQALQDRHAGEASRQMQRGALLVAACLIPALAWLAWAPLTSAVIAQGVVKIDLNRHSIQHAEGGVVREVRVREGQRVRRGEPLFLLGDVSVEAEARRLDLRVFGELATIARLEAEQTLRTEPVFPPEIIAAAKTDPGVAALLLKERTLLHNRRDALASQLRLLDSQAQKVEAEHRALQAQITHASEALQHQRDELETHRSLQRDNFVSGARIVQLEASVSDYAARLEERRAELARAEQRKVELELRAETLRREYVRQAGEQLHTTSSRLTEAEQDRRKSNDAAARQVISAPVDGQVMNLKVTAAGAILAPRTVVADVVPDRPRLIVEASVRPSDVASLRLGQEALIRFTAFSAASQPPVPGRVTYVSPDRLVDSQERPFYSVLVDVASPALQDLPGAGLQAGMSAEVFLKGEERSALSYLVEPILDIGRHAARER